MDTNSKAVVAANRRVAYLRFVIERIADYRISELDDLLPWKAAAQIAKTKTLAAAACSQSSRKDGGDRTVTKNRREAAMVLQHFCSTFAALIGVTCVRLR
jgi:hypothetical protein